MGRPKKLRLDDQLCFALYAATNTVTRAYRPLLDQIGLTYPQYLVMLVLWQDGEHAVHAIASRLALPPHALSPLIDRLEERGLVEVRRREPPDRRVVHVSLTAAGADLEVAASQVQRTVVCQTGLSDSALDELRTTLHDLVRGMKGDVGSQSCDQLPGGPHTHAHRSRRQTHRQGRRLHTSRQQGELP